MRSYRINMNRLINQLVPHYLGGRRAILFLQSCMQPLNSLNQKWKVWADEKRLEASMTSQVILLEYYLNHKFNKYFLDQSQRIVISEGKDIGVPMYWEGSDEHGPDIALYREEEASSQNTSLRYKDELQAGGDVSFIVCCPDIDPSAITQDELTAMISYYVRKYCIAGKKFIVTYG